MEDFKESRFQEGREKKGNVDNTYLSAIGG
jgi:hypothetical protein